MATITDMQNEPMQRITTPIFFIVDSSGSMAGTRIGSVNSAIEEVLFELRSMNKTDTDAIYKLALLEFNSDVKWVTGDDGLVDPENCWLFPLDAGGLTHLGKAYNMLEKALHSTTSDGFLSRESGSTSVPVLFLMTDGEPNDNWETELAKLKENDWFKQSIKIALGIGEEANDDVLTAFTEAPKSESVVRAPGDENKGALLAKTIANLALDSVRIASRGMDTLGETKQKMIGNVIREANEEIKNDAFQGIDESIDSFDPNLQL